VRGVTAKLASGDAGRQVKSGPNNSETDQLSSPREVSECRGQASRSVYSACKRSGTESWEGRVSAVYRLRIIHRERASSFEVFVLKKGVCHSQERCNKSRKCGFVNFQKRLRGLIFIIDILYFFRGVHRF
jgi:hypothetical protein